MRLRFPFFILLGLLLSPSVTHAGECPGCPEPSAATVIAAAGVDLQVRPAQPVHPLLPQKRDYLEMDAGDCEFRVEVPDSATLVRSWLVIRAAGEVWNCPESRSGTTITASIAREDSTTWSVSTSGSGGVNLKVVSLGVKVANRTGGSHGIREATDLRTTISATYCHRIPWLAYLRVGKFELPFTFSMIQPWAWWTKHDYTGAAVHQSGTYEQVCFSVSATLERTAPLAWHLRRARHACVGCTGITPQDFGWAPGLPPGTQPPPPPPEFEWPEATPGPGPLPMPTPESEGDDDAPDPDPVRPPAPVVPPDTDGSDGSDGSDG